MRPHGKHPGLYLGKGVAWSDLVLQILLSAVWRSGGWFGRKKDQRRLGLTLLGR